MEILNNNDVISVMGQDKCKFASGDTFKLQQLLKEYTEYIEGNAEPTNNNSEILNNSVECEVLRHDGDRKGWRKGKIKLVVQFEPDEDENSHVVNSLDNIWQQID